MNRWRWSVALLVVACAEKGSDSSSEPLGVQPAPSGNVSPMPIMPPPPEPTHTPSPVQPPAVTPPPPTVMSLFPECVTTGTIEASLRPANLLFLIDRSASMNCNLPPRTSSADCERTPMTLDPSLPSKWDIVRTTLQHTLEQLPSHARAGISYFSNDDSCGVQSQPIVPIQTLDEAQIGRLKNSLEAVKPLGGTPLVGGLVLAYKHLNPDQNAHVPDGDRFVVLLTDGQEGCAADQTQRLLDVELPKAKIASITTFVIGVPGSEVARNFLSKLAYAGGTPSRPDCDRSSADPTSGDCQFDMTRDSDLAAGLTRALAAIGNRALRCEFDVPRPANGEELDYEAVNVVYNAEPSAPEQLIKQDTTSRCADGANGWQYNDDRSKILLCGQACDVVRRAASIRIALGCKSVGVLL